MWATDARARRGAAACVLVAALLLACTATNAAGFDDAAARRWLNDAGCNACHGVDEYRLAPDLRSIAARYSGADDVVRARLARKIRYGGAGAWGIVPMISHPRLQDADIDAVVAWILALPATPAP